ncbi:MAG: DNA polymerase V subunit UmuD [Gammaproteobacteria bacterium]|jgi:DNA polymerase V|nr:DNA polymerase V subunit UmuD [Gammaproteobacteria bacterium]|tara:strand:- start:1722 stop:2123 length:402 start_codon:yes stop_codon:yes gene_type:complete
MFSNKDYKDPLSHKKLKHSGFPSPANDYIENPININDLLIKRASATFLMRFKGNEMILSGIKNNAILVIDRSLKAANGNIVVASIDGEFLCRKILLGSKKILVTDCVKNKILDIDKIINFEFLGVVTSSINRY